MKCIDMEMMDEIPIHIKLLISSLDFVIRDIDNPYL